MRKKGRGECEGLKKEGEIFLKNSILGGSRHRGGSVMILGGVLNIKKSGQFFF